MTKGIGRTWAVCDVLVLSVLGQAFSAPVAPVSSSKPGETQAQFDARTAWFREAKFGVFICWGPCSIAEGEIGWSRFGPRPGREPAAGGVPLETYDNLYRQFNPAQFDAKQWARLVKAAGASYVIFLTKHHDGFCMFDTEQTDYKITKTPFGRDVTGELARALQQEGIRILWYYSQPDWHHPDYRTERHDSYVHYLHEQIRELCSNYGKIDGMWFDGLGGSADDWDSPALLAMIHSLQPGAIINNRAGLPGDFVTPEQQIGRFDIDQPWESCITMGVGWSWRGADKPVKSTKECLHLLIRCAGGGGNLALDIGPMPDGAIDPRQQQRLTEMGKWLREYGETIYGTTGGPYHPGGWGVSTRKGDRVFLHILNWRGPKLVLPPLGQRIKSYSTLNAGAAQIEQTDEALTVSVPAGERDETDTIVVLHLHQDASDIEPISLIAAGSLTTGRPATSSSNWSEGYTASMAFDADESTRWGAEPGSTSGWLGIDLGAPKTIDKALILEGPWDRVRKFELQYRRDGAWQTFYEGEGMGDLALHLAPVTARHFRINILQATDVPTIWEVCLYGPDAELPYVAARVVDATSREP